LGRDDVIAYNELFSWTGKNSRTAMSAFKTPGRGSWCRSGRYLGGYTALERD